MRCHPVRISVKCPACDKSSFLPPQVESVEGCTCDCSHCGEMLVTNKGMTYLFHEFMNNQDPRWPVDGKDTHFVEMRGGGGELK